jgi:hypothetical protein
MGEALQVDPKLHAVLRKTSVIMAFISFDHKSITDFSSQQVSGGGELLIQRPLQPFMNDPNNLTVNKMTNQGPEKRAQVWWNKHGRRARLRKEK